MNFLTYKISQWLHIVHRIIFKLFTIWSSKPLKAWPLPTSFLPWLPLPLNVTAWKQCSVSLCRDFKVLSTLPEHPFCPLYPLALCILQVPAPSHRMSVYSLCGKNSSSCSLTRQTAELWAQGHKAPSSTSVTQQALTHRTLLNFKSFSLEGQIPYLIHSHSFIHPANHALDKGLNKEKTTYCLDCE